MEGVDSIENLDIYEIKIGGIKDGLSFRKNQRMYINNKELKISNIIVDYIKEVKTYLVFAKDKNGDEYLIKSSERLGVYVTYDV